MTLVNARSGPIIITDVKIAWVSVYALVRAELLKSGRLEDADDDLTLLPGDSLLVETPLDEAQGAELWWLEE